MKKSTNYSRMAMLAEIFLGVMEGIPGNPFGLSNKTEGGYMTVYDMNKKAIVNIQMIGNPVPEKILKFLEFSQEKVRRLDRNFWNHGHETSWDSRNIEKLQYPGAVKVGHLILSFSGIPALADEALMMAVASKHFEHVDDIIFSPSTVYANRKSHEGRHLCDIILAHEDYKMIGG